LGTIGTYTTTTDKGEPAEDFDGGLQGVALHTYAPAVCGDDFTNGVDTLLSWFPKALLVDGYAEFRWPMFAPKIGAYEIFAEQFTIDRFSMGSLSAKSIDCEYITCTKDISATTGYFLSLYAENLHAPPRVDQKTSLSSLTADVSLYDLVDFAELNEGVEICVPIGNPKNGQKLMFRFQDHVNHVASPIPITWVTTTSGFAGLSATTMTPGDPAKTTYYDFIYNSTAVYWDLINTTIVSH
jgi:hypothetical protein